MMKPICIMALAVLLVPCAAVAERFAAPPVAMPDYADTEVATTYPLDRSGETTILATSTPVRFFRLRVTERQVRAVINCAPSRFMLRIRGVSRGHIRRWSAKISSAMLYLKRIVALYN